MRQRRRTLPPPPPTAFAPLLPSRQQNTPQGVVGEILIKQVLQNKGNVRFAEFRRLLRLSFMPRQPPKGCVLLLFCELGFHGIGSVVVVDTEYRSQNSILPNATRMMSRKYFLRRDDSIIVHRKKGLPARRTMRETDLPALSFCTAVHVPSRTTHPMGHSVTKKKAIAVSIRSCQMQLRGREVNISCGATIPSLCASRILCCGWKYCGWECG